MSTSQNHKAVVTLSLLVAAASVGACGSSGGEPSDPHDKLAAVKDAISSPSGTVSAQSMKNVASMYNDVARAQPVFTALGLINNESAKACLSGSASDGKYDLACATNGSVTGSMSYQVDGSAGVGNAQGTILVTFDNACASDTCVSGTVIAEAKVASGSVQTSVAYSADVTQSGKKTHVFFGENASVANNMAAAKIAMFDSAGESYVIETSVSASGASYSVAGSNGTFQCSITSGGTGQCSGSASFSF